MRGFHLRFAPHLEVHQLNGVSALLSHFRLPETTQVHIGFEEIYGVLDSPSLLSCILPKDISLMGPLRTVSRLKIVVDDRIQIKCWPVWDHAAKHSLPLNIVIDQGGLHWFPHVVTKSNLQDLFPPGNVRTLTLELRYADMISVDWAMFEALRGLESVAARVRRKDFETKPVDIRGLAPLFVPDSKRLEQGGLMLPYIKCLHFLNFQLDEMMQVSLLSLVRTLDNTRKGLEPGTCSHPLLVALDYKDFWSNEEHTKSDSESYEGSQVRVEAEIF